MLKTIFLGNSDFCMPTLEALYHKTELLAIVTGLDKIITQRSSTITQPLPKIFALKYNIPLLQPKSMKDPDFINVLQELNPDMMVIISYGKILPASIFNIPFLGTFNLHASLLPAYRGASPIQESLLQNDTETGITLQKINEKMDDGNIYWKKSMPVPSDMYYPELRKELSLLAKITLEEFLDYYITNHYLPKEFPQKGIPSFCGKITKQDGFINFSEQTAQEIYNKFRAFYSWPQITTSFHNKTLKLEAISIEESNTSNIPAGEILQADKKKLLIQTQKDAINIKQLKIQDKKSQDYISFINGYKISQGDKLC